MWYLIDTGLNSPYYNMAYDESLMDVIKDKETVVLHFFNFEPVSITIGYHQKVEPWLEDSEKKGILWVRRPTGGRAIIHCNDCTYSLLFHRDNPIVGGNILNSYKKIAAGFKKAFEYLDIPTLINRGKTPHIKRPKTPLCFSSTSFAELSWINKKIIGSAQFRNRRVVLQQGTIMLDQPGPLFPDIQSMATIKEACGKEVSLSEMKESIIQGFKETFCIKFSEYRDNPLKENLLNKYRSKEWNSGSCDCYK
ncbi:lipoate--protein ligase family protein [candidate division WOR-3 bacterium]|nr:lipoate--protein ligase family protein [candidate division WOR-3 bacterium]